ncbi:MAG: porin [Pseudomonadota bacterium]|nr:porin [Pseudomonadota bacterium]
MNKKLIALAVAGACFASDAMAQTANPVTLYGRAYLTLESIEAKGSSPLVRRTRIEDQSSLLGVRGTEDLGGGLKAFFQLETAFRLDQAGTGFANRNSGVGLQGGWGSFLMGRWDSPFKVATIAVDPFGDLTIGGITVANNDQGNFDNRFANNLQYWSPNFGGFAFRLASQVDENRTSFACGSTTAAGQCKPRNMAANVTFTRGPIYAFAAYEEHKDITATVREEEGAAVGGSFAFGPVKLGGLYEEFKRNPQSGDGFHKRKSWMASVVWTLGNNQFIYQHQDSEGGNRATVTATTLAVATSAECDVDAVGYQYNFSRRTFFLAQYVRVDNKNSNSTCGSGQFGSGAGADPRGVSLGLRHVF